MADFAEPAMRAGRAKRQKSEFVNSNVMLVDESVKKLVVAVSEDRSIRKGGGEHLHRKVLLEPPPEIAYRDRGKGIANVGLLAPKGMVYRNLGTPNMSREVEGLFGPRQEGTRRTRAGHKAELTWGPALLQLYDEHDQARFAQVAVRRGHEQMKMRPSGLPELDLQRVRRSVAEETARRRHIDLKRDVGLGNGFILLLDEVKKSSIQVRTTRAGRTRLLGPTQDLAIAKMSAAHGFEHGAPSKREDATEQADPSDEASPRSPLEESAANMGSSAQSQHVHHYARKKGTNRRIGHRDARAVLERKARMAEARQMPLRQMIEQGEIEGVTLPDIRTVKVRPSTREVRDEIARGLTSNVRVKNLPGEESRVPYAPGINVQPNGLLVFRDDEKLAQMQREDLDYFKSKVLLDPELSLGLRKLEFQASQFNSVRATKTALQEFLARRQDNYEWKFRTLQLPDSTSPRGGGHASGSSPQAVNKLALKEWRMRAAEEIMVADQERLISHPWFAGLADLAVETYVLAESNKISSSQGGSALTIDQTYQLVQCVDLIVKSVMYLINSAHGFARDRYFELVLLVPPWLHDCLTISSIFTYLAKHVGISPKENRAFYQKNSIPLSKTSGDEE